MDVVSETCTDHNVEDMVIDSEEDIEDKINYFWMVPYEILYLVFSKLGRKDINTASKVSDEWLSLSLEFLWIEAYSVNVCRMGPGSFRRMFDGYDIKLKPTTIVKDISAKNHYHLVSKENYLVSRIGIEDRFFSSFPLEDFGAIPDLFSLELRPGNNFQCLQNLQLLSFSINLRKLKKRIALGDGFPGEKFLCHSIGSEERNLMEDKWKPIVGLTNPTIPMGYIPEKDLDQPPDINLNLHGYQIRAIDWMSSLEKKIDEGPFNGKINDLTHWKKSMGQIAAVILEEKLILNDQEGNLDHSYNILTRGGVLADEMGLGKTIQALGLILSRPAPEEMELEFEGRVNSRASLIICPSQLCRQWKEEIQKSLDKKLKVHVVTTMRQHKSITGNDVVNADVIIVSFQFLKNRNYIYYGQDVEKKSVRVTTWCDKRIWLPSYRKNIGTDGLLQNTNPLLEFFQYQRILLDEGHEIVADNYYAGALSLFHSNYRWYITGTPFPSKSVVVGCMKFIGLTIDRENFNLEFQPSPIIRNETKGFQTFMAIRKKPQFKNWSLHGQYYDNVGHKLANIMTELLFWRTTKESAEEEQGSLFPEYEEQLFYLEFSELEKALYRNAKYNKDFRLQRELCCHAFVNDMPTKSGKNNQTLEDIRVVMIEKKMDRIAFITENIAEYRRNIDTSKKKIETDPDNKQRYKRSIERLKRNIKLYQTRLAKEKRLKKSFKKASKFDLTFLEKKGYAVGSNNFVGYDSINLVKQLKYRGLSTAGKPLVLKERLVKAHKLEDKKIKEWSSTNSIS
eukprot:TRINITY_DN5737_c0_g1_i3.p1 TRINITY_DN5737_c0_g1~~TRINITY_DN5737_c0_g1_i3.p1  ORF type:complete len:848 (+),score=182.16 TRINITY_DN5737_c0_g1_i3:172-2544(+)